MTNENDLAFFKEHGYLKIENMFNQEETDTLCSDLDFLLDTWATKDAGWSGPWREVIMDAETSALSKLVHLHDLQFYSQAFHQAFQKPRLVSALSALLGENVELHHSTLHLKPPQTGHPFPMHQDMAFYEHKTDQYIDVLIHLDDTFHENGEIRFMDGSHKSGYLEHVTWDKNEPCTPHLPAEEYPLDASVPVPAKRDDVVLFNINTIHGSHINQTNQIRRMIRVGYRNPANRQVTGQSLNRPGFMIAGKRDRSALPGELKEIDDINVVFGQVGGAEIAKVRV